MASFSSVHHHGLTQAVWTKTLEMAKNVAYAINQFSKNYSNLIFRFRIFGIFFLLDCLLCDRFSLSLLLYYKKYEIWHGVKIG